MTKGATIFIFRRGSDEMHRQTEKSEAEKMKLSVVYSGAIYLGEEDAQSYFKCNCEYMYNTSIAICLTATMQTKVDEYTKALTAFFNQE